MLDSSIQNASRIAIIGSSGSGKTTLGRTLSSNLNLPMCDLDELAWLPGWREREREEERLDVEKFVAQDSWIVIGNYSRHRDLTWGKADLIIWLDLPLHSKRQRNPSFSDV